MSVKSDPKNLYFLGNATGDVSDGTDNSTGFDVLDINIGLKDNTAPWRYALQARNNSFGGPSFPSDLEGDWEGRWQAGDDNTVANASFGVPGSLTETAFPAGIQWAVDDMGGNRVHEVAIPWDVLLDGVNGWTREPDLILAIAGSVTSDGAGTGFPDVPLVDFGDQSTYAFTEVSAVPLPAAAWLFLGGLGALGAVARRRARQA